MLLLKFVTSLVAVTRALCPAPASIGQGACDFTSNAALPTITILEVPDASGSTRTLSNDYPTETFTTTPQDFTMMKNWGTGADQIFECPKNSDVKLGCTDSGSEAT